MNKKTLILFTGPSTAGKTTFTQLLLNIDPNLFPVIQTSCRPPRTDDDYRFLRLCSKEDYNQQEFWVKSKDYGILKKDIRTFLLNNRQIGIGISGVREAILAKELLQNDIDIKIALVRLSSDPMQEEQLVTENILTFFANPEVRIEQNRRHIREFFANDQFIHQYVDLILARDTSLLSRIQSFGQIFNSKLCQTVTPSTLITFQKQLLMRQKHFDKKL